MSIRQQLPAPANFADTVGISKKNNFNLIRLAMALCVLYSHSFVLFKSNGSRDVFSYLFTYFDGGSFGVSVFFLISGLLLTQSFHLTSNKLSFVIRRIFRLFPAYIVCILLTIFIVGALGSDLSLNTYYQSRGTYRYLYNIFMTNRFFIFNIPYSFEFNKKPQIINGSLWTLPFELLCYGFLFCSLYISLFIMTLHSKPWLKWTLICILSVFGIWLFETEAFHRLLIGGNERSVQINNPYRLYLFFASGVALYYLRQRIHLGWRWMAVLTALFLCKFWLDFAAIKFAIEYLAICTFVIMVAGFQPLFRFNWKIDPSYGIYLYAWPVQQIFARFFQLDATSALFIAIPCAFALGIISYLLIEKPALQLASKIIRGLPAKEQRSLRLSVRPSAQS